MPALPDVFLIAGAGFLAGAVNAVAGGGSLISFPALLAVGYPSVTANVTNSIAVLPGYLGGSIAYRDQLAGQGGRLRLLGAVSAAGAVVGAVLLLIGPESVFRSVVPFLILLSCALLLLQPTFARLARARRGGARARAVLPLQFAAAIYGGYFGAGLGILMLALLGICLDDDLHRVNALKGALSFVIGFAAALVFVLFAPVAWPAAIAMACGSLLGGRAGVAVARRLDARVLRLLVVALGVGVAATLLR